LGSSLLSGRRVTRIPLLGIISLQELGIVRINFVRTRKVRLIRIISLQKLNIILIGAGRL
jgi:hypothetical protein